MIYSGGHIERAHGGWHAEAIRLRLTPEIRAFMVDTLDLWIINRTPQAVEADGVDRQYLLGMVQLDRLRDTGAVLEHDVVPDSHHMLIFGEMRPDVTPYSIHNWPSIMPHISGTQVEAPITAGIGPGADAVAVVVTDLFAEWLAVGRLCPHDQGHTEAWATQWHQHVTEAVDLARRSNAAKAAVAANN
jgi:hypothetical protein